MSLCGRALVHFSHFCIFGTKGEKTQITRTASWWKNTPDPCGDLPAAGLASPLSLSLSVPPAVLLQDRSCLGIQMVELRDFCGPAMLAILSTASLAMHKHMGCSATGPTQIPWLPPPQPPMRLWSQTELVFLSLSPMMSGTL